MTHSLPDKAVEAGARAIARLVPCGDGSRWMPNHGNDFPSEYSAVEQRLIRAIAKGAIEAALALEGLVVVRADRLDIHRQRGKNAIAEHLCSTNMTDGFCCPRNDEGKMSAPQQCVHMAKGEHRDCCARAEGLVRAFESRGCKIVWMHDRAMIEAAREG